MNEEQIKTQEFIFRDRRDEACETTGKKSGTVKFILAGFAVAIAIAVLVLVKPGAKPELSIEDMKSAACSIDSYGTDYVPGYKMATIEENGTTLSEVAFVKPVKQEEQEDTVVAEDDILISDNEIIGIFGTASDILDLYRADDPELPSYLTLTINEDFKMQLSSDEIELLMRLVEAEAPAEDIYGRILVANVVLNRVLTKGWAKTVTGVIYEKVGNAVQFSSTAVSGYWNSIVVSDLSREAVMRCLAGEDYSNGALFFYAWKKHPELTPTTGWISAYTYLFKHGGHAFYR